MRRVIAILGTCLLLCIPSFAQETREPFSLSVNTSLTVRVVAVRDAEGNAVEGLRAEDFTLTEDGVPQTIRVFEFQKIDDAPSPALQPSGFASDATLVESGTGVLSRRSGVPYRNRRLLAFYFDLQAMQDVERKRALEAAREFVSSRMAASDLVAIFTYSEGFVRLVRDFTDDRHQLIQTIEALIDHRMRPAADPAFGQNEGEFNIFTTDRRLMALQTAARMLGVLSEEKALIYFSTGVGLNVGNQAQLRATLNEAVRANVSIYSIDSRGLSASAPLGSASQRSPGGIAMYTGALSIDSMRAFQQSQDALYVLAADTGGKALLNSNKLSEGIVEAQHAISSHYVLGYYPTDTALDGRLRHLNIAVKDRSMKLSYREGYYAGKDFSHFGAADKERQLEDALLAEDPITEVGIAMELNYFRRDNGLYFVPVAVQISGSELVLSRKAGADRAMLDFIGEIRDESGRTVTNLRDKVEIKLTGDVPSRLVSRTVQYDAGFILPSGRYVIKFLARNAVTGKIGTYQTNFVVPNVDDEAVELPISSVVLGSQRTNLKEALYDAGAGIVTENLNPLVHHGQKLIPGIGRAFSKTRPLYVYLEAYGEGSEVPEAIAAFVTFYRTNEKVFEVPVSVQNLANANSKSIPIEATINLNKLQVGEYTLQVTVLHPAEQRVAVWRTQALVLP